MVLFLMFIYFIIKMMTFTASESSKEPIIYQEEKVQIRSRKIYSELIENSDFAFKYVDGKLKMVRVKDNSLVKRKK